MKYIQNYERLIQLYSSSKYRNLAFNLLSHSGKSWTGINLITQLMLEEMQNDNRSKT